MVLLGLYGTGLSDGTELFATGYAFGVGLYLSKDNTPEIIDTGDPGTSVKLHCYVINDIKDVLSFTKTDIPVNELTKVKTVRVLMNAGFYDALVYVSSQEKPSDAEIIDSGDWEFYLDVNGVKL